MHKKLATILMGVMGAAAAFAANEAPQDGALAFPKDYPYWATFLRNVQRPDVQQVRELYVSPIGTRAKSGEPFPTGTIFVMENHQALPSPTGSPNPGPIAKIFVMQKVDGKPAGVPEGLQNGSWVYGSFSADGKAIAENYQACRGCHLPLAQKDFVQRYDEYFEKRATVNQ